MTKYFKSFFTIMSLVLMLLVVGTVSVKAATVQYKKVTSTPADWSGTYLIVYEEGSVAFNGALDTLDAASNKVSVTISNGVIEDSDNKLEDSTFTITKVNTNYTIQSTSGYYIGQTSNANGLKSNKTTTYQNTLSINNDGNVNIVSGGAYLRYNAASDQNRFRYYQSSTYAKQKAITLYKLVENATDEVSYTVTFNSMGGSSIAGQNVSNGGKVVKPADPTKEGCTFGGWYKEDTCTNAWNFATDTVTANTTLYAKWEEKVTYITIDGEKYDIINNVADITTGKYIIGTSDDYFLTIFSSSSITSTSRTNLTSENVVQIDKVDGGYNITLSDDNTIGYGGNSTNFTTALTSDRVWNFSLSGDYFTITNVATETRAIAYRDGYNFRCYSTSNITTEGYNFNFVFYKLVEETPEPEGDLRETEAAIKCQYKKDASAEYGYTKLRVLGTVYTESKTFEDIESIEFTFEFNGEKSDSIAIYTLYTSISASGTPILAKEDNHYYAVLVFNNVNTEVYHNKEFKINMTIKYTDGTIITKSKTIIMGQEIEVTQ